MLLAQMLADLSSLKATSPSAASALVNANKSAESPIRSQPSPSPAPGTEQETGRAATLKALYSLRAKLSQHDNSALIKVRERVDALAAQRGGR
ncbi:hypothetical protein Cpir12675_006413 [Ceratocystis pirilliformis]|uniref:Uncharacterized protein n=1 Tax=Ceratocystis pirilliformis TaxID=259994 RepID=A0ABR3YHH5_9PEZI